MGLVMLLLACSGGAEVEAPPEPAVSPVAETAPAAEPPPPVEAAVPKYSAKVRPLSEAERAAMTGVTWTEGCPLSLDQLRVVELNHWKLSDQGEVDGVAEGLLVVAEEHAVGVAAVFQSLFKAEFPLTSVRPAHEFGGDDDVMMRQNNTSAFNCRAIKGTDTYSEHSYGHAIDVNPLRNPWVQGDKVDPPEGSAFVARDASVPGVIVEDGPVVAAFAKIGWRWGGLWTRSLDYQHFSASGK